VLDEKHLQLANEEAEHGAHPVTGNELAAE